jgi:predicted type IV restriction endonuclease
MSFREELVRIRNRAARASDLLTEEAAKNALVMPMLKALGYDVFDPDVVIPEFTADVGTKKGEKVDYAIKVGADIALLIECKPTNADISKSHISQLYRYFTVTTARIGVVTNGIEWHFFSDLDKPNIMDSKPFLRFNVLDHSEIELAEVEKFRAQTFDIGNILSAASDLKFMSLITDELRKELETPSEEFVRMIARRVYDGQVTAAVRERFTSLLRACIQEHIREEVNRRLLGAMQPPPAPAPNQPDPSPAREAAPTEALGEASGRDVETTEDEHEAFRIVRSISRSVLPASRIAMRDSQSYCAILADDNNRRPIVRLYFNRSRKRIGVFDKDKAEERIDIESLDDLYSHADKIISAAKLYAERG